MNIQHEDLAKTLIKMQYEEQQLGEKLFKENKLYDGYNEEMENLHIKNAEVLENIIFEIGWPTVDKVGMEGSYAAWLILQHAISKPSLQRKSLPLLQKLADNGKIDKKEVAMLYDRICYFEMRPQKYGTQFDFDEHDQLVPWEIKDPHQVDVYRSEVGLPPLQQVIDMMKEKINENEKPTIPYRVRYQQRLEWAKRVGWITE